MTEKQLMDALRVLEDRLRDKLVEWVDERVEQHRQAVWVNREWCCQKMADFAMRCWSASAPKRANDFGSVAYEIQGKRVNYCPFCGVSVLRVKP